MAVVVLYFVPADKQKVTARDTGRDSQIKNNKMSMNSEALHIVYKLLFLHRARTMRHLVMSGDFFFWRHFWLSQLS